MADASFDRELRSLHDQLLDPWNRRDASAMATLFAAQGNMIGFDGSMVDGTAGIEAHLEPIFASHPTPAFIAKGAGRWGGNGIVAGDCRDGAARKECSRRFRRGRPELKEKMTEELRALMPGAHR
jgi:hypothetical protein